MLKLREIQSFQRQFGELRYIFPTVKEMKVGLVKLSEKPILKIYGNR